jgi:hypothetical protein
LLEKDKNREKTKIEKIANGVPPAHDYTDAGSWSHAAP